MKLQYVLTDERVADVLTKSLPNMKFEYLRSMLDLVDITDFVTKDVWKKLEEAFFVIPSAWEDIWPTYVLMSRS